MKYGKLEDNVLIYAPSIKDDIFNYNSDYNRDMLYEDGYKEIEFAQREEGHFYSVTWKETKNKIKEVLEDITEETIKQEKIKEIDKRIEELKKLFAESIVNDELSNIKIYQDVIKGLEDTKEGLL